jgi:hypothetical protein
MADGDCQAMADVYRYASFGRRIVSGELHAASAVGSSAVEVSKLASNARLFPGAPRRAEFDVMATRTPGVM